jgi:hypothetical protein
MYSYICIVAPHLGTLAETREGRDIELTRRWCWWIHPEDGRTGQVPEWGMLAKRVLSDKLWLESDPRQAPEHYKPPNF